MNMDQSIISEKFQILRGRTDQTIKELHTFNKVKLTDLQIQKNL